MKFVRIVFLFLAFCLGSKSFATLPHEDNTLYVLTVPKCGTHLLEKYFTLLKHKGIEVDYKRSHLSASFLGLPKQYFYENPNLKKVILIRDYRDAFCSLVPYMERNPDWLWHRIRVSSTWRQLPFEEKLAHLIDYEHPHLKGVKWEYHKSLPLKHREMLHRAVEFADFPNTCFIRFEKLVGPEGGVCTREEQLEEMNRLNDFIGIEPDKQQMAYVIDNLFGNKKVSSYTFRKGKCGEWKKVFTEELKELFKERYGEDLIKLGYETGYNW